MLGTEAADVFLIVASVCMVLLTIVAVVVGIFVIRAALEVHSFVLLLKGEAQRLLESQRRIIHNVRFAKRWVRIMLQRMSRTGDY